MSAPPSPRMHVVCAWCMAPLPAVPCAATQAHRTSHGICPACYIAQIADLDALAGRQVARDVTPESFVAVREEAVA